MANVIDLSWVAPELLSDITSVIRDEVISYCQQVLFKHVYSTVYARSPGMYERTYDVLSAVTVTDIVVTGSQASFEVKIDAGMLSHISPTPGAPWKSPWGSHAGFKNQQFTEGLIEILDEGGGSSWHSHPAANFYKLTFNQFDSELLSVLASGIAARGWDVSY